MEASMKKWLIALATLVVLLIAGVVILFFSLSSIVVKAVNTEGPNITQTAVHLDTADISLFSGTGVFNGFTIGNPEGFSGNAVSVQSIVAAIDTSTAFSDTIVIPLIEINRPELVYELSRDTSNFDVLLKNVQSYAGSGEAKTGKPSAADTEKSGRKVIIDELIIRDAKATLSVPLLKLSVDVPLPEIRMKNIGRENAGVSIGTGAVLVMKEVTGKLVEAASSQSRNLSSALMKGGENVGDAAKGLLKEGENAGDKAKNLLKEGLGLFK